MEGLFVSRVFRLACTHTCIRSINVTLACCYILQMSPDNSSRELTVIPSRICSSGFFPFSYPLALSSHLHAPSPPTLAPGAPLILRQPHQQLPHLLLPTSRSPTTSSPPTQIHQLRRSTPHRGPLPARGIYPLSQKLLFFLPGLLLRFFEFAVAGRVELVDVTAGFGLAFGFLFGGMFGSLCDLGVAFFSPLAGYMRKIGVSDLTGSREKNRRGMGGEGR